MIIAVILMWHLPFCIFLMLPQDTQPGEAGGEVSHPCLYLQSRQIHSSISLTVTMILLLLPASSLSVPIDFRQIRAVTWWMAGLDAAHLLQVSKAVFFSVLFGCISSIVSREKNNRALLLWGSNTGLHIRAAWIHSWHLKGKKKRKK